mmetsp:Transcript_15346/g.31487  ORF Transcript_15346/g.31487 Transcript_15346/m.31487 type:complete len:238 (-) Transcript_15346:989-1702(-)
MRRLLVSLQPKETPNLQTSKKSTPRCRAGNTRRKLRSRSERRNKPGTRHLSRLVTRKRQPFNLRVLSFRSLVERMRKHFVSLQQKKAQNQHKKTRKPPRRKKLRGDRQSKTKPDESSSVLRFKRRKRQTTRTQPSRKKQQEVQCEKSTASSLENDVPSEIVAFHDFQMSPLEDPDVLTFPKVYRRGSNNASKHKPTSASSKNSSLLMPKRRRKTFPKTYQKKKKIFFDVSGNDVFDF